MIDKLDISEFQNGKSIISLGYLPNDIALFLSKQSDSLAPLLNSSLEILFWKDRIEHTKLHKNDFISDNEFITCLENIPQIIENPDYLSIHPKDDSISFIKDFSGHVSVAVRISASGKLSYRTMYPITDAQLNNYLKKGRAWKWSDECKNNTT